MSQINGHISQIIGPVIDVFFDTQGQDPEKVLPKIYEAMTVKRPDGRDLVLEVEQHIGEDTVRCIAMDSTDGLERGLEVKPLGAPIQMPSGDQIRGRMMNVIGQPIDGMKPLSMEAPILFTVRLLNLRTVNSQRDATHGYQGHRPAGTLHARRQDRFVRWCRCR